ncbi:hypothetical protein I316_02750 [Kwoniella heveanensis BCC8398]|uniref:Uncharacterized protein n=1 Tax=Kwoniella heveanensis BCC8398 TaxID=1296120 RepID=A0A1B9GXL4_9TREE|nr:hypothetical protein I316_02750 [Kwoniella heveanensis BCC8398]
MDRFSVPPAPVAGPSRSRTPFRPPIIQFDYNHHRHRAQTPTTSTIGYGGGGCAAYGHAYGSAPSSSRSSTPVLYPNGARFRSVSVVNADQQGDADFRRKRVESVARLRTAWDLINEKYGSVALEDDDEIDLRTGEIVRDRGKLRDYVKRGFGEVSDSDEGDDVASSVAGGTEIDPDDDELGGWADQSGLDPQGPEHPLLQQEIKPWDTAEDLQDLKEFYRLEAERAKAAGELPEDGDDAGCSDSRSPSPARTELDGSDRRSLPRWMGTEILPARLEDLFLSDGDEKRELSSEDELDLTRHDSDDEATRKTPAPPDMNDSKVVQSESNNFSRKLALEVVIPTRSRHITVHPESPSPSLLRPQSPEQSPAPRRPMRRYLTYNNIVQSKVSPTLADLFNSPPPAPSSSTIVKPERERDRTTSPLRAWSPNRGDTDNAGSPSVASVSTRSLPRRLSRPVIPVPSTPAGPIISPALLKDKGRMPDEKSIELEAIIVHASVSPKQIVSPYCKNLWKSRSGNLNFCKSCRASGGERAIKAVICKGRRGPCPFSDHGSAVDDSIGVSVDNPGSDHDDSKLSAILRAQSPKSEQPRARIRTCRLCREAGGERAKNASTCRGRVSFRGCKYERVDTVSSVSDGEQHIIHPQASTPAPHASAPKAQVPTADSDDDHTPLRRPYFQHSRKDKVISRPITGDDLFTPSPNKARTTQVSSSRSSRGASPLPRPTELDPEIYVDGIAFAHNGRPRRCPYCRRSSDIRAARSWWCKGRTWSKPCTFLDAEDENTCETHTTSSDRPTRRAAKLQKSASGPQNRHEKEQKAIGICTSPAKDSSRKRRIKTAPAPVKTFEIPNSATESKTVTSSLMPTPPPSSSVEPPSPSRNDTSYNIVRLPHERTRSSSTLSFSMPPSSPPISSSPLIVTEDRLQSLPTPSPSVSADSSLHRCASSPAQVLPMASLPRKNTTTIAATRPTPPSSTDGHRSSSIASDQVPLTLPRKSALRRPSDSSAPSSTGSVKRARFSLQPHSPLREASSDPYDHYYSNPAAEQDVDSDDELSLCGVKGGELDFSPYPTSSPLKYPKCAASSSSPLRNEWSVRAADIGVKLGPERTGRISSHMLEALAPALPTFRPTLGSSIHTSASTPFSSLSSRKSALATQSPESLNTFRPVSASASHSVSSPSGTGSMASATSSQGRGTNSVANSGTGSGLALMLPPSLPIRRLSTPMPAAASSPTALPQETGKEGNALQRLRNRSVSISGVSYKPATPRHNKVNAQDRDKTYFASARRYITPSRDRDSTYTPSRQVSTTPSRKIKTRRKQMSETKTLEEIEKELAEIARRATDEDGLEWGLDDDCEDEDGGRMWRRGSVVSRVGVVGSAV